MIAPLRRRHRRIFGVLAVLLPIVFVGALLVRPEIPRVDLLPAAGALGRTPFAGQPEDADPLLYWSASAPSVGDSLPSDARLLGSLRSGDWLAGEGGDGPPADGARFVYSLVEQRVTALVDGQGGEL